MYQQLQVLGTNVLGLIQLLYSSINHRSYYVFFATHFCGTIIQEWLFY